VQVRQFSVCERSNRNKDEADKVLGHASPNSSAAAKMLNRAA
jgi:hypothetical protein